MIILTEYAFQRKVFLRHIQSFAPVLQEHLMKYYALDANEGTQRKWVSTIVRVLFQISREQPKSRRIGSSDYYKYLYTEPFEGNRLQVLENFLDFLSEETGIQKKRKLDGFTDPFIKSFFWWVCNKLPEKEGLSLEEVENKLKELAGE